VPDVSDRRKLVPRLRQRRISLSRACELLSISRRRLTYASKKDDAELVERLKALARAHPRFGVRQLWRMIRREDEGREDEGREDATGPAKRVNLKRVRRLCRKHGLLLKQRRRRKRLGIGIGLPCSAEHPNHVWSYDFVEDRTETGRKLRILTVVDEFTRRCLAVEVEHRMNAKFVGQTLLKLFAEHGTPGFVRSDNGPEFIARFLMRVLKMRGVEARHIDPGSPWQNGIDERFNGTLRDECLNLETFHGRDHARALVKLFGRFYNERRPHSSLGKAMTPNEFYERWRKKESENDGCATRLSSPKSGGGVESGLCPEPRDLALCASSGRGVAADMEGSGPTATKHDRPDDRRTIHVGAPVASRQSRILRVDAASVTETSAARTFPAAKSAAVARRT
jgi:putative transposase